MAKKRPELSKPRSTSKNLSNRQMIFCREYVLDRNGKMAAIRAGYAPDSAEITASKLLRLPKVQAKIALADSAMAISVGIDANRLGQEYRSIALSNITDFLNPDGTIALDKLHELPKHMTAAIESVQVIETTNPKTKEVTKNVKIKLYSKTSALEAIGRHLGFFKADNEQKPAAQITFNPPVVINLTRDGLPQDSSTHTIPVEGTTIDPVSDQEHT
jgi:phage terminase small subunit